MTRIWRILLILLAFLLVASGLAQALEMMEADPSMDRVVLYDPTPSTFRLPARVFPPVEGAPAYAQITVNFTNFTAEQKTAFMAAAQIWADTLTSTVPITIDAAWADLTPPILGQSGPNSIWKNFTNSKPNQWYVVALANKLAGKDLDTSKTDMHITFNNYYASNFYYGVDGNPPADKTDFVTVILHEICHGLGFFPSFTKNSSGLGAWGSSGYPYIMDPPYYNGSNQQLINTVLFPNPSAELLTQYTSNNVYYTGANAVQANGGKAVKIYAPTTWTAGSSMSHWDTIYRNTPNALMTYAVSPGSSIHDPGPITLGLFQDIGWTTVVPSVPSIGFAPASLTPSCQPGKNASSQTFEVWNSDAGTLNYSISDNATWLSCTPTSGSSTGERDTITVKYATSGLAAGTYKASITITASGASNTPQTIPVTLTVSKVSKSLPGVLLLLLLQ